MSVREREREKENIEKRERERARVRGERKGLRERDARSEFVGERTLLLNARNRRGQTTWEIQTKEMLSYVDRCTRDIEV